MRISDWSSDVCSSDLQRKLFLQRTTLILHVADQRVLVVAVDEAFLVEAIDVFDPAPVQGSVPAAEPEVEGALVVALEQVDRRLGEARISQPVPDLPLDRLSELVAAHAATPRAGPTAAPAHNHLFLTKTGRASCRARASR